MAASFVKYMLSVHSPGASQILLGTVGVVVVGIVVGVVVVVGVEVVVVTTRMEMRIDALQIKATDFI